MKQLLKIKGPDGRWQTVASYEIGQYGPRVGINREALRAALDGEGWANFSIFESDGERQPQRQEPPRKVNPLDDESEVPF